MDAIDDAPVQVFDALLTGALAQAGVAIAQLRRPSGPDIVACCEALRDLAARLVAAVDSLGLPADAERARGHANAALRGLVHCAGPGYAAGVGRDRAADELAVHARGVALARDALRERRPVALGARAQAW